MLVLLLAIATAAIWVGIGDPRRHLLETDRLVLVWVFVTAAWPFIVIYFVGPLIWATAASAGTLSPALQYFPAAGCAITSLVLGLKSPRGEVNLPAVLIGTLLVSAAITVWLSGFGQLINFVMAVVLFCGVLLKRHRTSVETLGNAAMLSLGAIAGSVTLATLVNSSRVLADCRVDKCGLTAQALTSPFAGNGNVLGMATVLLVPFAVASLSIGRTLVVLAGVGMVQILALSRTAIFALAVVSVALILIKLSPKLAWKLGFAYSALFAGLCASIYPLFLSFSGSSVSYRGYVWEAGRDAIGRAPVFGHGPTYWYLLAKDALFDANYSPHNGWYDIMIAVGAWGVVVIIAAVAIQIYSTSPAALPYLIAYYACVLSINIFESVYVPYFFGIIPFAALLPLMLYEPRPIADPELERDLVDFQRSTDG